MQPYLLSPFVKRLALLAMLAACQPSSTEAAPAYEAPTPEVSTVMVATRAVPRVRELPLGGLTVPAWAGLGDTLLLLSAVLSGVAALGFRSLKRRLEARASSRSAPER